MESNRSQLYDLPKDILVKLVCKIRQETIEEITKPLQEEINRLLTELKLYREITPPLLRYCDHEDCMEHETYINDVLIGRNITFVSCRRCGSLFCENHETDICECVRRSSEYY